MEGDKIITYTKNFDKVEKAIKKCLKGQSVRTSKVILTSIIKSLDGIGTIN